MKVSKLIKWSKGQHQNLPWRVERTLYRTLVSEIMLQQTTVSTVLNHFERFVKKYPNYAAVAKATEEELGIAWKGLGYYRRARNLQKACHEICESFDSKMPLDFETLKSIPGIGDYTANAILAIGADKKALALDANLERVLARLYQIEAIKGPKLQKEIQARFESGEIKFSRVSYRELNEGLMDLGRVYCQARKATCELCPLSESCQTFQAGADPLALPYQIKKEKEKHELELLRLIVINKDQLYVYKKPKDKWLSGQLEVPTFIIKTTDKKLDQYPLIKKTNVGDLPSFKTTITKYKITNKVLVTTEVKAAKLLELMGEKLQRADLKNYQSLNLSTATMKALERIQDLSSYS